jgi:hypothetical protein
MKRIKLVTKVLNKAHRLNRKIARKQKAQRRAVFSS